VSATFLLFHVCTLALLWGATVAARRRIGLPWRIAAMLLYAVAALDGSMLVTLNGDGRILPGRQLNPDVVNHWANALAAADSPFPGPAFYVAALLAHALLWAPKPDRAGVLAPLPATLAFAFLFLSSGDPSPGTPIVFRGVGPDETAYLTLTPKTGGRCRMIVASGPDDATFLPVRYEHDAESPPLQPRLRWSKDGQVLVVSALREDLLALPRDGDPVGFLPTAANAWPREDPTTEPADAVRARSEARLAVSRLVAEHGGFR